MEKSPNTENSFSPHFIEVISGEYSITAKNTLQVSFALFSPTLLTSSTANVFVKCRRSRRKRNVAKPVKSRHEEN